MDDNSRRVLRDIAGLWEADAARLEAQAQADAGESYTYGEAHAWREAAGQLRQRADSASAPGRHAASVIASSARDATAQPYIGRREGGESK